MRSLAPEQASNRPRDKAGSVADLHCKCFACGRGEDGLGLTFDRDITGSVSAEWFCARKYQSYPGILHGGIVATILDCAMTNCLLLQGIAAVTAEMHIDYQEPIRIGDTLVVKASLVRCRSPLYVLEAEIAQDGRVRAKASAKFMSEEVWSDTNHV